jgi:hypothetical protein
MSYAVIACRLPNGILAVVDKTKVRLNGANAENAVAGFGFTRVPADFAEAWLREARDGQPAGEGARRTITRRGGIFAADDMDDARARAREMAGEIGGFERLDPERAAPGIVPTDETRRELAKSAEEQEAPAKRGRGRPSRAGGDV